MFQAIQRAIHLAMLQSVDQAMQDGDATRHHAAIRCHPAGRDDAPGARLNRPKV